MAKLNKMVNEVHNYDWKKLFFELVVVFLGVTAGFLLNSWQQERQDQKLERKYLEGFLEDVNSNTLELEETIKSDCVWLNNTKPKLLEIQDKSITVDSATTALRLIVGISKIDFQSGTYEDITNSGNLNIIRNYTIKKQIVDYYITIKGVAFIDSYFYQYFNDFVMPFIFTNFSVLDGKLSNPEIIKTTRFANVIAGYFPMVQQRKAAYDDLLSKSYSLKRALENKM